MLNLTPAEFEQVKSGLSDGVLEEDAARPTEGVLSEVPALARDRVVANAGAEKKLGQSSSRRPRRKRARPRPRRAS
jgi:hypothetical protein